MQIFKQSDSVIQLFIFAGIQKGHAPILNKVDNLVDGFRPGIQLSKISSFELQPFAWLMIKPFAQLSARGNILDPQALKTVLTHPAWPKTVHQNTRTVVTYGIVNSFDCNTHIKTPGSCGGTNMPPLHVSYDFFRKLNHIERSRKSNNENAPTANMTSGSMRIHVTVRMNSLDVISGLRANHRPSLTAW